MTDTAQAPPPPAGFVPRRPEGSKPVRPRDAASLVLVKRDGAEPAVLMGRRHRKHAFMPDVFVFPGGRLDLADRQFATDAPAPEAAGGGSAKMLRALALTAVRETFEETGLLIGRAPTATTKAPSPSWQAFLDTGQVPAIEKLTYIYRAITPPMLAMRFHARFFMADAAHATGDLAGSGELLDLAWYPLADTLKLPIADITETLLRDLPHLLEGPRRPVPLFCAKRGRVMVVGGTLRGTPV
jgi:8-oxo-dGTP pyrophosphatase MutT (NUDIX family)